jgi:hypothetical protein
VKINAVTPFVARTTMATSGSTMLLALAGATTAAVLIFTASLAVLWPVLIGCACVAPVGIIIFMVVRCASLKNGGGNTEKDGKLSDAFLQESALSQIPNMEAKSFNFIGKKGLSFQTNPLNQDDIFIKKEKEKERIQPIGDPEEILAPKPTPIHPRSTKDMVIDFADALKDMDDSIAIATALENLSMGSGDTKLSGKDRGEICRLLGNIAAQINGQANTLGDLRRETIFLATSSGDGYALSNDALPFLIPILALFPDSEFSLIPDRFHGTLTVYFAFHDGNDACRSDWSFYSILNHTHSEYYGGLFSYKNWAKHYGAIMGTLALHYDGNGHLIIDNPLRSGNPSQMAG